MKVIQSNIIPFPGYIAVNLFGVVFVRKGRWDKKDQRTQARILNHEAIHTAQMKELAYVGFYVIYKKDLNNDKPAFGASKTAILCMAVAFVVGIYDGFYGPGTGTFLLLLLTGVARLDVFKAAGVTKAINLTTNVTALIVFLASGTTLIGLGITGGIANIAGNYLGAKLFSNKGSAIVRPIILVVIIVFAVRLILQLAGIM